MRNGRIEHHSGPAGQGFKGGKSKHTGQKYALGYVHTVSIDFYGHPADTYPRAEFGLQEGNRPEALILIPLKQNF